ncbi:hypothetical protein EW026_g1 [Hermanssonia centrifuga]|uniref:C2 domain-containing protein n=1 Tax=Hermanssonia centrifuga TaxID=98765 RepID=A0A4V3XBQ6_9APHY|nr:hypothetical protein EW026_g1 [Hermanssonia centrifuga]
MSRHVGEDPFSGESGPSPEPDPVEIDVYCEIYVNGQLSGRTTVKRSLGSPDWHEKFIFPDLPPFQNLEIVVFREKRLMKPILIGSAVIPLMNFRRGEHVEGWFPVLGGQTFAGIVMGEVKMKLKVDEEIILPYAVYSKLLQTLQAKNLLDWIYEIECKLQIKNVLEHIVPIARAKNILIKNLIELADREVDGTLRSVS